MIPQLVTQDLAQLMAAQRAAPADGGVASTLAPVLGTAIEVVGVAAGARWDGVVDGADRAVLIMAGLGTIIVDDWRATVGPGLAVGVPAKKKVAVLADGGVRLEVLVVGRVSEPVLALEAVPVELAVEEPQKSLGADDTL